MDLSILMEPGAGRATLTRCRGMGGAVERADADRTQRAINHEVRERFPDGAALRAVLLRHREDPASSTGDLMVRVFIPAPGEGEDYEAALAEWEQAHRTGMEALRRELSLRLPSARVLEVTFDDAGPDTPRIMIRDDGSLAAEQMSGREIVTAALALLRANYVFPELAGQAAAAIEARLAGGEYGHLDGI